MTPALPLHLVELFEPMAADRGVSRVARAPGGFLEAFRAAGGELSRMSSAWQRKREGFVARHAAQALANGEPPFLPDGTLTRRHLALVMWAYSPVKVAELHRALHVRE